jgi:hypothetical protein
MGTCCRCQTSRVELRTCAYCRRPVCRSCAQRWHEWGALGHVNTVAECRVCFVAAVRRLLEEARASLRADGIEPRF